MHRPTHSNLLGASTPLRRGMWQMGFLCTRTCHSTPCGRQPSFQRHDSSANPVPPPDRLSRRNDRPELQGANRNEAVPARLECLGGQHWPGFRTEASTLEELKAFAAFGSEAQELHASIDGVQVQNLSRIVLAFAPFSYTVPATDNMLQSLWVKTYRGKVAARGFQHSLTGAASDGYCVDVGTRFLRAHITIEFWGDGGKNFRPPADVTYTITVVPKGQSLKTLGGPFGGANETTEPPRSRDITTVFSFHAKRMWKIRARRNPCSPKAPSNGRGSDYCT